MALTIKSSHKLSNGMSITDAYLMIDQQGSVTTKDVLVIAARVFASKEARDNNADPLVISQNDPLAGLLNPIEKQLSVVLTTTQVQPKQIASAYDYFVGLSEIYLTMAIEKIHEINNKLPENERIAFEIFTDE